MSLQLLNNPKKYEAQYGKISSISFATLQRSLLAFEGEGQDVLFDNFGKVFNISQFFRTVNGRGVINILSATRLINSPRVYALFLLWLLQEIALRLPEVGDMDRPFLAFFFDESHLLFKDASKVLIDQVERLVKMVRSKGIGVFFATQSPADIPDRILSQLGNRVQHALRCYTPKDRTALRAFSSTFRTNSAEDVEQTIMELGIGEALVSFLDSKGVPEYVQRAYVYPPRSKIGAN
jgi:DNA helicase HerA-like ATPase